jgi:type IV pilus assembly protein PilW
MYYSIENKESGFTLIELLIAMTIGLIILTALSSTFLMQRKIYDVQEQVAEMVQTARAAMDMMSREIRMAGYAPTGGTMQRSDPIGAKFVGISYDANKLQIYADLNGDEDTDDSNEGITYTYDAANLQIDRNTGGGDQPFAENIDDFKVLYQDADGNTTSTTANIRQIEITITARTARPDRDYSANSGYRTYTLTSFITPRNLGL